MQTELCRQVYADRYMQVGICRQVYAGRYMQVSLGLKYPVAQCSAAPEKRTMYVNHPGGCHQL